MEIPLLTDIVVIFALSLGALLVCHRLKIPGMVGFLATGVICGPHGLGLVGGISQVEVLAEVGVVMLLFTVGLEFSFRHLMWIGRSLLVGGSAQAVVTTGAAALAAVLLGRSWGTSVFIGFLVTLSSTAIVMRLLQQRAEVETPHGRTCLAILIFQDIAVVPMMLAAPLLAGAAGEAGGDSLGMVGLKAVGVLVLVVAGARWVVPFLLLRMARTRQAEVFLLGVLAVCLAVAWVTSHAGLSLALGAFLAGLILSESGYGQQALGTVLPFRDVFASFFFVSVGMLLDTGTIMREPLAVGAGVVVVILGKALVAGGATLLMGYPPRTALLVGLGLAQVGEFSFILSRVGVDLGLLSAHGYQLFLAVSVVTMAATPFLVRLAPNLAGLLTRRRGPVRLPGRLAPSEVPAGAEAAATLTGHVVIVGYGVCGRNVARAATLAEVPYVILEMNPDTVKAERAKGESIFYGDASYEAVQEHAGVPGARVMVVAMNDAVASRRIVETARHLNSRLHIIARTRFLTELEPLRDAGADEIIPEEFETSIEIFSRVLGAYLVPRPEIEGFVAEAREDGYGMLRSLSGRRWGTALDLADVEMRTVRVAEGSRAAGKTLADLNLRRSCGVTALAFRRGGRTTPNPDGDTRIEARDILVLMGRPEETARAMKFFQGAGEGPA